MSECLFVFADEDCIVAVQDTGSSANGPAAAAAPKPGPAATFSAPAPAPKPGPAAAAPAAAPKPGPAPAAAALVNIYKGRLRSSFKKPIRYR